MSWDDDDSDDYDPIDDEADYGDELPNETIPCRKCGEEVYEDAIQCVYCGEYDPGRARRYPIRSEWFWVFGLIGIIAVIASLLWIPL